MYSKTLQFESPRLLSQLYCASHENLEKAEKAFKVNLVTRDNWLEISAEDEESVAGASDFFELLKKGRNQGLQIRNIDFENMLDTCVSGQIEALQELFDNPLVIQIKDRTIVPKNLNQKRYLKNIKNFEIVFGIGPAGTGKTYLAVAAALQALTENKVDKIILTRPAIEAGEALGFLPGDLSEKIRPYLRPLYDAIFDILDRDQANRLMERNIIEVAPLAYMRGRTLANAYIILDEAQNTTPEQMMMFLTRLGENSRIVVTGDITQIDLPRHKTSGLKQAIEALYPVGGIKFFYFDKSDVVRHHLVQKIIEAYEHFHKDSAVHL